jgi:toxin ParE1/3/4
VLCAAISRWTPKSSRKPATLNLSPREWQDFINILRFTGETWGQNQLFTYRDKINDALQANGHNPQLGHRRDDLPATHLAYLVGSLIIIYRANSSSIGIVRILHQRMSLGRHT